MKKVLTLLFSVVMALVVNAQTEVTKFLGIPVDGTKAEMVQKIKAKGFETSSYNRDFWKVSSMAKTLRSRLCAITERFLEFVCLTHIHVVKQT